MPLGKNYKDVDSMCQSINIILTVLMRYIYGFNSGTTNMDSINCLLDLGPHSRREHCSRNKDLSLGVVMNGTNKGKSPRLELNE